MKVASRDYPLLEAHAALVPWGAWLPMLCMSVGCCTMCCLVLSAVCTVGCCSHEACLLEMVWVTQLCCLLGVPELFRRCLTGCEGMCGCKHLSRASLFFVDHIAQLLCCSTWVVSIVCIVAHAVLRPQSSIIRCLFDPAYTQSAADCHGDTRMMV